MRRRHLAGLLAAAGLAFGGGGTLRAQPQAPAPTTGGAPIDRGSFAHQRRIPPGPAGVSLLRLDIPALAHSRLADIRLVTADGFQVPYLLEADDEPLRVVLPALTPIAAADIASRLSQRQGRTRTVYGIAFPLSGMPPCDLVLETNARVFEREVSLLMRSDRRGRRTAVDWETAAWGSWRHADPETPAAPLVLHLPALSSAAGRLVVDEGDNRSLPIAAPAIELRTYRLRFVRESGQEMWLVYGSAGLTAPRYDLALLQPRLSTEEAREVTAQNERPASGLEVDGRSRAVFWGVLIVTIVALLAVVARLLVVPPGH
jgi:hypothetical protein